MLRILVVLLVAGNLLLLGLHVSDASPVDPLVDAPAWHMPAGAQRLQLASELPPPQPQPALRRQCFSAGPFETVPALVAAREALPAGVLALTERESEALVELGYWVSLPAATDFAAAHAVMQKVDRAGLHDVAVVGDRSGAFRVSLGYFLEEANARQRRDTARALGFTAETELQRETQPRYWLDYAYAMGMRSGALQPGERAISCAG